MLRAYFVSFLLHIVIDMWNFQKLYLYNTNYMKAEPHTTDHIIFST